MPHVHAAPRFKNLGYPVCYSICGVVKPVFYLNSVDIWVALVFKIGAAKQQETVKVGCFGIGSKSNDTKFVVADCESFHFVVASLERQDIATRSNAKTTRRTTQEILLWTNPVF